MKDAPTISLVGTPDGGGALAINLDACIALKEAGWSPPVSPLAVKGAKP